MNPDLLIFDLDGTTADTRRDLTEAVNRARDALGLDPLPTDTVTSYVGDGVAKLIERSVPDASPADVEKAKGIFDEYYDAHCTDYTESYPGISDILNHFSHKTRALVTNKDEGFARRILEHLALIDQFDLVVGGRPGLRKKPAPDAVLHILETLDIKADRAMLIGDGPQDILAAKAAGVSTCAVTYGFRPVEELRPLGPDLVIDHPSELVELLT